MFILSVESYHIFTILQLYLWMSAKFGLYWSLFNTSCMGCLQSIKFRIQPALAKSKTSVSRYLQHATAAGYKPAPQLGRYLQFITQNLCKRVRDASIYTSKKYRSSFILERYFFVSIYPAAIPGTYLAVFLVAVLLLCL